jgi:hypothetical protein
MKCADIVSNYQFPGTSPNLTFCFSSISLYSIKILSIKDKCNNPKPHWGNRYWYFGYRPNNLSTGICATDSGDTDTVPYHGTVQ